MIKGLTVFRVGVGWYLGRQLPRVNICSGGIYHGTSPYLRIVTRSIRQPICYLYIKVCKFV